MRNFLQAIIKLTNKILCRTDFNYQSCFFREIKMRKSLKQKLQIAGCTVAAVTILGGGYIIEKYEGDPFTIAVTKTAEPVEATKTYEPQVLNEKININTADAELLETLMGVGESMAQNIIDYRTENGKFLVIEDIKNVKGIGDKIFERIKNAICVE